MEGSEAHAAGLVFALADDPTASARTWIAEHLASKSPSSLRHGVKALRCAWARKFTRELARLESEYLNELMSTHDACEGIQAFLEKRSPQWANR